MKHLVTTLVLAGSRPGIDPLVAGTGLPSKALLPIAGKPMLAHVLASLVRAPEIGRIVVVAQATRPLAADPAIGAAAAGRVEWHDAQGSIADAVAGALDRAAGALFVTTADNVLLTPAMIAQFLSDAADVDVAVGLVERRRVETAGYSTARTWLKFRGGQWSGANLFLLAGNQVMPLVDFWRSLEQDRKRGMKIVGAFGPALLIAAALRLIDIHAFAKRVARRFGLRGKIVSMLAPEACIDADKPSDIAVIEAILARRQSGPSA